MMMRALRALVLLALAGGSAGAATAQTFVNPTLTPESVQPLPDLRLVRRVNTAVSPPSPQDTWRGYRLWADRHPEAFRLALQRHAEQTAPQEITPEDSASNAVALAVMAADELNAWEARRLAGNQEARDAIRTDQIALRRRLEAAQARTAGWPIVIFATGTVSESLGDGQTEDDDGDKPLGTGSMGVAVGSELGTFTARVSIISTDAVAPADFGPMVLTPGSGASLSAGLLDWRARGLRGFPNHYYAGASRLQLRTSDDGQSVRATVLAAGALWAHEIFNEPIFSTRASLTVEGGAGLRWLNGDVASDDEFTDVFRAGRSLSIGPEAGFSFTFGRVVAASQIYYLANSGSDVPGLNGLQMVAGLSLTGEFLDDVVPARRQSVRELERAQRSQERREARERRRREQQQD